MTIELLWLTYTLLLTALLWVPYVLDRMVVRGLWAAVSDRQVETGEVQSPWAKRAMAAHRNAIENLVIFAGVVLVAHALDVSTPSTRFAAVGYFGARLAHFIIYTLGLPVLRTLSFTAGWVMQLIFIAAILSAR